MSQPAATAMEGTSDRATNRQALLEGAAGIYEVLASHCAEEEHARTLSDASVDALYHAGMFAMKLPECLGGSEADPVTQFEVLEALSRANASAGWCTMVGATSLGMPGAFLPEEGAAKMFGGSRLPRGAITIMPAGEATPVEGGYRLSGRWSFASGIRHAEWVTTCARRPAADGPPDIITLVFPAHEVRLHDNWRVAGLKGTGSSDYSVDDLFVPESMTWEAGSEPRRGGPLYRLGIPAFVANEHAAFALGVARQALDALVDLAREKSRGYGPAASKLASRPTVQRFVGRAELALGAARALALELNERAWERVCGGQVVETRLQTELRSVATYCTEVAGEVITDAFRHAGASAVFEQSVLQRCLRDVNVAAQHLLVNDTAYEALGRCAFGFEDVNPMG